MPHECHPSLCNISGESSSFIDSYKNNWIYMLKGQHHHHHHHHQHKIVNMESIKSRTCDIYIR